MKSVYNLLLLTFLIFFINANLKAETYFLDFNFILNKSKAGMKANKELKIELDEGIKKLQEREKQIQKNEKEIIQQKKVLSPEDYKKKINTLRTKVSSLKKDRNSILETVSKKRRKARNTLLQELNPIIKSYMIEKKIKIVLDKKNILLADEELDITNDVVNLLNEKLKSISLN